jgi:hypothetical protein
MRMVNISNEKSMQSYTARCSRYKNKYTNLVCGKTAVGRNYNLPRDRLPDNLSKNFGHSAGNIPVWRNIFQVMKCHGKRRMTQKFLDHDW